MFLDCSHEQTSMPEQIPNRMQWLAHDLTTEDWFVGIDDAAAEELTRLGKFIEDNPQELKQRKLKDTDLPLCRRLMSTMKNKLDHGVGFAVLDRLDVDAFELNTLVEIYWLLGQMIGPPVAQKWNGQMIYDVRDTGQQYSYGVRGSHTNVELLFHTDNAFARMVPDYVGLFCRHPAKAGGISRFCSLYSVHHRMQERHPKLLQRLYQPMLFDRQKEHHESAATVCFAPFFSWKNDRLFARANTSLVRKGYEVAAKSMDSVLEEALEAIDEISSSEDLWYEAGLVAGQIQYLNNHEIGHYRSQYKDFDEPEKKRHLFRLWHRREGSSSYDGLYLDD